MKYTQHTFLSMFSGRRRPKLSFMSLHAGQLGDGCGEPQYTQIKGLNKTL